MAGSDDMDQVEYLKREFLRAVRESDALLGAGPVAVVAGDGTAGFRDHRTVVALDVVAATAVENARILAEAVQFGCLTDRRIAYRAITEIVHGVVAPLDVRLVAQPRVFAPFERSERWLRRARRWVPRLGWTAGFAGSWTVAGLGLALLAGVLILLGDFLPAAIVIAGVGSPGTELEFAL